MNATIFNKARSLVLNGVDHIKAAAPRCSLDELEAALAYAQGHRGSKSLVETLEREIKKKQGVRL